MRKINQVLIALFLIPVYLLAFVNFFWPDQLVSKTENRNLAQMPAFSVESLFSGRFTSDFEAFFTDQFPFRQFFISVHRDGMTLLKSPLAGDIDVITRPGDDIGIGESLENDPSDLVINTDVTPTPTPTSPSGSESVTDPAESTETLETTGPTEPEATAPDVEGKVDDYSAVIIVNDFAMELYYYNAAKGARYADLVSELQLKVPGSRVFSMVAPTSLEFNSPAKYHSNSSSQKNAIADIYSHLSNGAVGVDAYNKIALHYGEYLYFRTDHHWTARGAYYAYAAFCQSAGLEAMPMDSMQQGFIDGDFLGSLYKYTNSAKLAANPDHVEYFLPVVESAGVAYNDTAMKEGYKVRAVSTTIKSSNKYLAFIGGDHPLTHFKTELTNGRSIVILKESYGNAIVPFLTNNYEDVYVIDPRSLSCDLPAFIKDHGIQDVLILNYAFSVSNANWISGFEKMIG